MMKFYKVKSYCNYKPKTVTLFVTLVPKFVELQLPKTLNQTS